MCLIAIAWNIRPDLPLALIANRDEFHDHPSAAADFDVQAPTVYGGRDLVQGGSWLLASSRRRLAAVTNVRDGSAAETPARSRGWLVRDFARSDLSSADFARGLKTAAPAYGRFNLLVWDGSALWFASNHPHFVTAPVAPGLHAMSNGAFDAPWPKSTAATRTLREWQDGVGPYPSHDDGSPAQVEPLFAGLRDTRAAPDATLPDTGIGLERERRLSPAFIEDPRYGTRCSSLALADGNGVWVYERRFDAAGYATGTSRQRLDTETCGAS